MPYQSAAKLAGVHTYSVPSLGSVGCSCVSSVGCSCEGAVDCVLPVVKDTHTGIMKTVYTCVLVHGNSRLANSTEGYLSN